MEALRHSEAINNLARTSVLVPLTMPLAFILLLLNLKFLLQITTTAATAASPKTLNITAIAANAQKESVIECWQLTAPFITSAAAGISGASFAQLGETGATSYGLIPAEFNGGLHNAPVVQWVASCILHSLLGLLFYFQSMRMDPANIYFRWVAFMAGEAIVSLPNSTQKATIRGGRYGLILAADTANASKYGHITKYPSKKETVAIQIPTANNEIPSHSVLYEGACRYEES